MTTVYAIAVGVAFCATANATAKSADQALADALSKQGYVSVPIIRDPTSTNCYVQARYGEASMTLLIDTGANIFVIDKAIAERLKVEARDTGGNSLGVGGQVSVHTAFLQGLRIGPVECPRWPVTVFDLTPLVKRTVQTGGRRYDGVLGSDMMVYYAAVLDIANNKLHLLDPARRESKLQGEWVLKDTTREGVVAPDARGQYRVTVKGTTIATTNNNGKTTLNYSLVLDPYSTPKRMDWVAPDGGRFGVVYGFDGSDLIITSQFSENDEVRGRLTKLIPGPSDKFTALRLKRRGKP